MSPIPLDIATTSISDDLEFLKGTGYSVTPVLIHVFSQQKNPCPLNATLAYYSWGTMTILPLLMHSGFILRPLQNSASIGFSFWWGYGGTLGHAQGLYFALCLEIKTRLTACKTNSLTPDYLFNLLFPFHSIKFQPSHLNHWVLCASVFACLHFENPIIKENYSSLLKNPLIPYLPLDNCSSMSLKNLPCFYTPLQHFCLSKRTTSGHP